MPFWMPPADANAVLDRMRACLGRSLSVDFMVSRRDIAAKASGSLVIQRPNRMKFLVKLAGFDYECWISENGTIDLSRSQKVYMETHSVNRLYQPSSHYTELPDLTFPLVILAAELRELFPERPALAASQTINGIKCDVLKAQNYEASVAPDGRLIRFVNKETTWTFTNYKFAINLNRSAFEPAIPNGFRQFVLPRETMVPQPEQQFPTGDWVTPEGAPLALPKDKACLILVTSADCAVSARAKSVLEALKGEVGIVLLTDSRAPAELAGFAVGKDKEGRTLERLSIPATPFFFLIGKTGIIQKTWLGFGSKSDAAFLKDVRATLGGA